MLCALFSCPNMWNMSKHRTWLSKHGEHQMPSSLCCSFNNYRSCCLASQAAFKNLRHLPEQDYNTQSKSKKDEACWPRNNAGTVIHLGLAADWSLCWRFIFQSYLIVEIPRGPTEVSKTVVSGHLSTGTDSYEFPEQFRAANQTLQLITMVTFA